MPALSSFVGRTLVLVATCASLGCEELRSPPPAPVGTSEARRPPSLFEVAPYQAGVDGLTGALETPIRALSVTVQPDRILLQAQDAANPTNVDQYVYRIGSKLTPVPVKLKGKGKLEDNLFPLAAVKLDVVPELVTNAESALGLEGGQATRVHIKRNLPDSMDILMRVTITGAREDGWVDADRKGAIIRTSAH